MQMIHHDSGSVCLLFNLVYEAVDADVVTLQR